MAERRPYALTRPCALCPFRTDVKPYLTPRRVREIEVGLARGEFPCHETTGAKDGEVESVPESAHAHCAGALILLEKLERPSQMMRISERLGLYDRTRLDMDAPVFDSFEEMIDAQPRRRSR